MIIVCPKVRIEYIKIQLVYVTLVLPLVTAIEKFYDRLERKVKEYN